MSRHDGFRPPAATPASRHLPASQPVHHGRPVRGVLRDRGGGGRTIRGGGGRDLRRDGARRDGRADRAADQHPERLRCAVRLALRRHLFRARPESARVRVGAVRHGQARVGGRVLLRRRHRVEARPVQYPDRHRGQAVLPGTAVPPCGGDGGGPGLVRDRLRNREREARAARIRDDDRDCRPDGVERALPQLQEPGSARPGAVHDHSRGRGAVRLRLDRSAARALSGACSATWCPGPS